MFCTNCGQKIEDDAQFCEHCGTRTTPEQKPEPVPAQAPVQPPKTPKNSNGAGQKVLQFVKKNKILMGVIAAVVVIAIAVGIFFATRPTTVELNQFISVKYSGYDTAGIAEFRFDTSAFCEAYADKIEFKGQDMMPAGMTNYDLCQMFAEIVIKGHADKDEGLSNGDQIVYTWDIDPAEVESELNIRLSFEDITYTVYGLDTAKSVDPFEGVELKFEGIAPNASVDVIDDNSPLSEYNLHYEVTPNRDLDNGTTITITLPDMDDEFAKKDLLRRYGITLTQTSKTYTVEGLDTHVKTLSAVTDEALEQMQKQVTEKMTEDVEKYWSDGCTLNDMTYLGSYLLVNKDPSIHYSQNLFFLIYKNTVSVSIPDDGVEDTFSYYHVIRFSDLVVSSDGTVTVDTTNYSNYNNQFTKLYEGSNLLYFRGYETLDEAYKQCVTENEDEYTSESNVEDK